MSYSIDDYPESGKPVDEGSGGEDPPQRGKSHHKNQQQQASPVGVLSQGHHLPENNNPDKQSSHQSSHHQQQQQNTLLEIPSSSGNPQKDDYPENQQTTYNSLQPPSVNVSGSILPGYQSSHQHCQQQQPLVTVPSQVYHPKSNDLSNHQSPNRSHQPLLSIQAPFQPQNLPKNTHRLPSKSSINTQQEQTSVAAPPKQRNPSKGYPAEVHREHPEGPNLTQSNFPVKDQPKLQPMPAEMNPKVYQQTNSHSLKELTIPEGAVLSPEHLSIPEGFPPPGPPSSPSKLEPRPKKGLLKKICCCCCCCS